MKNTSFSAKRFASTSAVVALTLLAFLQTGDRSLGQSVPLFLWK